LNRELTWFIVCFNWTVWLWLCFKVLSVWYLVQFSKYWKDGGLIYYDAIFDIARFAHCYSLTHYSIICYGFGCRIYFCKICFDHHALTSRHLTSTATECQPRGQLLGITFVLARCYLSQPTPIIAFYKYKVLTYTA
jgi:hypothetical protein